MEKVLVNVEDVEAEMAKHRREYRRCKRFLESLKVFGKPQVPVLFNNEPTTENRSGQGKKSSGPIQRMREFVMAHNGTFEHPDLKAAAMPEDRKHIIRQAIRDLESEGTLEIVKAANGRFRGEYRRKASHNGKAADNSSAA
jgi:hypothetical protein